MISLQGTMGTMAGSLLVLAAASGLVIVSIIKLVCLNRTARFFRVYPNIQICRGRRLSQPKRPAA